jgi:hypothetical protein
MSERGYFSQRNLIPGATFLLLLLAYNLAPVIRMLERQQATSSLFAAAVALIGSPAFGFLVSQLWWCYFQGRVKTWSWEPVQFLIRKYNLLPNRKRDKEAKRRDLMVYDYVLHSELHSGKGGKKGLSIYAHARWDNYILLSTTKFSLALGAFVGFMVRVISWYFILGDSFWNAPNTHTLTLLYGKEPWIWLTVTIVTIILWVSIWIGRKQIKYEYDEIHKTIIQESEITRDMITKAFPDYFPKNSDSEKVDQLKKSSFSL